MQLSFLIDDKAAVLDALWAEFARLNALHFAGTLTLNEIYLSTRKQYGGYCMPRQARIVLSWQAYREYGFEEVLETFRHEVAHLVYPDHSRAFWELAAKLGCTKRYAQPPLVRPASYMRYIYECPVCKKQIARQRRLRVASCGKCDRKYNPDFTLYLVSSPAMSRKQNSTVRA